MIAMALAMALATPYSGQSASRIRRSGIYIMRLTCCMVGTRHLNVWHDEVVANCETNCNNANELIQFQHLRNQMSTYCHLPHHLTHAMRTFELEKRVGRGYDRLKLHTCFCKAEELSETAVVIELSFFNIPS